MDEFFSCILFEFLCSDYDCLLNFFLDGRVGKLDFINGDDESDSCHEENEINYHLIDYYNIIELPKYS